ncbi:MAG: hypothetical protein GXP46_05625 [Deferribacteres bacterium]|nr:hypothetical protein [Deferribacteres bacterium]
MKPLNLVYINSISREDITTMEDVLRDKRLTKYLWIEFILNPSMVELGTLYMENAVVRHSLIDALSWYLAFRWLFPENRALEDLYKEKTIIPYRIRDTIYREKRRGFLKGIMHARLC